MASKRDRGSKSLKSAFGKKDEEKDEQNKKDDDSPWWKFGGKLGSSIGNNVKKHKEKKK